MKPVRIHMNRQLNGITFGLPLATQRALKEQFPAAQPVSSLFVGYEFQSDSEPNLQRLKDRVPSLLLGLDDEMLKTLSISFWDQTSPSKAV